MATIAVTIKIYLDKTVQFGSIFVQYEIKLKQFGILNSSLPYLCRLVVQGMDYMKVQITSTISYKKPQKWTAIPTDSST